MVRASRTQRSGNNDLTLSLEATSSQLISPFVGGCEQAELYLPAGVIQRSEPDLIEQEQIVAR